MPPRPKPAAAPPPAPTRARPSPFDGPALLRGTLANAGRDGAILEALDELAARAPDAAGRPASPRRDTSDLRLISAREAARRLGVSRGKTIATLIGDGKLRTVVVNGRQRIPASEVERLAREGFDVARTPARPRRR